MQVVVFGSGGQLGRELVRVFDERGYTVYGAARQHVDITDEAAVASYVERAAPDIVINAAAYNQVDVAEREPVAAYHVNALAVRHMALACRQHKARLVHFSTDYVFDGTAGRPYTEEDHTHPLGAYAVSKLAGELYAQAYLAEALIIRVSGVFGPGGRYTARGNFPELMLRLAGEGKPLRVVEDHFASPTYAPELASRTADLVGRNSQGVFHVGGGEAISWYEYARAIFLQAGVEADLQPTTEAQYRTAARRPKFSALSNQKMELLGIAPMPPLTECIRRYLEIRNRELSGADSQQQS